MRSNTRYCFCIVLLGVAVAARGEGNRAVTFSQSSDKLETYDFVETAITVKGTAAKNPFTDVVITGQFGPEGDDPIFISFPRSTGGKQSRTTNW
jgi:hypothetical protein